MSKTAFIFPGQGAQKVGMGKDFYEHSQIARAVYDQASKQLDLDIKELCFEENDRLDITEYTQVALVTTCIAMAKMVMQKGLVPDVTAGLSLGEYVAITMAGGMSVSDAIATVRRRGILMQHAVPPGIGSMAAVLGLSGAEIQMVLQDIKGVSIANYNCPGQIVITGYSEQVKQAHQLLMENGAKKVITLNVSGPFHSPLLKGAGEELGVALEQVKLSELQIPYVTNVTAEYVSDISQTKALLEEQVAAAVKWQQSVERMILAGVDTFVEIGPGRTLTGFLKKINREVKAYNIQTVEDVEAYLRKEC